MLSGHTHGGQIAPFGVALKLPHGSGGYVAGWYRGDGVPLYVSRGIGTSLVPIRIGATPELAQFDWSLV
jgi:predicted MPP superfamily phosphohydrolase